MQYFRPILKLVDYNARFLTDENIEFICDHQYHSNKKIKNTIPCSFYSLAESIRFYYGNYMIDKSE